MEAITVPGITARTRLNKAVAFPEEEGHLDRVVALPISQVGDLEWLPGDLFGSTNDRVRAGMVPLPIPLREEISPEG
jgi:hypothetical protein